MLFLTRGVLAQNSLQNGGPIEVEDILDNGHHDKFEEVIDNSGHVEIQKIKNDVLAPIVIIHGNDTRLDAEKVMQQINEAGRRDVKAKKESSKITYFLEVRNQKKLAFTEHALFTDPSLGTLGSGKILMIAISTIRSEERLTPVVSRSIKAMGLLSCNIVGFLPAF